MAKKTKDVYEVTEKVIQKCERLAARGLTIIQIGASLGWSEETIHKKKRENPELAESIKRGQSKGIETVSNALFKRAKGYAYKETHEEIRPDKDGNPTNHTKIVKKQVAPDVTAQIFYLKNRDAENWKDKQDHKVSSDITLNIVSEFDAVKNEDSDS